VGHLKIPHSMGKSVGANFKNLYKNIFNKVCEYVPWTQCYKKVYRVFFSNIGVASVTKVFTQKGRQLRHKRFITLDPSLKINLPL
jgi:hypothetical protein